MLVRKHGAPQKFVAKVLHVGHECDCAVLTVEDEEFWQQTVALEFGDVPSLQDTVVVIGYPTGGDNMCVVVM